MSVEELLQTIKKLKIKEYYIENETERKILYDYVLHMRDNLNLLNAIIKMMNKIDMTTSQSNMIFLVMFINTIEGPFNVVLNIIIYMLIKNEHHDLWDDIRRKFITTFDDVFNISLAIRLEFLAHHGFDCSSICQKTLRNAIAHQSYRINEEGTIEILKKRKIIKSYSGKKLAKIWEDLCIFIDQSLSIMFEINTDSVST